VKGLVREAAARELWVDTADALMGQVVRWTITAYYDHPYDTGAVRWPARGLTRRTTPDDAPDDAPTERCSRAPRA
jgi:hypothetical protein